MNIKKILVPVDFSKESGAAIETAMNLADTMNATVSLLHVVETPNMVAPTYDLGHNINSFEKILDELKESAEQKLEGLLEEVNSSTEVKTENLCLVGVPFDVISETANERGFDLIVMGTKGSSGIQEVFIGSIAEKVVRFSEKPVLVVHKATVDLQIKNIVYASEFEEETEMIPFIKALADFFKATIHLVRINNPSNFESTRYMVNKMKKFAADNDLKSFTTNAYDHVNVEQGITYFMEDVSGDLLAVRTHGRKGLNHLFTGSTAEGFINHLNFPVLTIKINK